MKTLVLRCLALFLLVPAIYAQPASPALMPIPAHAAAGEGSSSLMEILALLWEDTRKPA
jgi:hypothetical protein